MGMDLKVAQLRKLKGVSQQELAKYLGVTFQSVSKWETKNSLPDITLLPELAKYFQVTVDEVLGLVPIGEIPYIPRNTDDRRMQAIRHNRQFFWNDDYLVYLVTTVWKIDSPINLIEFCCCDGDLGKRLMNILPKGSTYTGVDREDLIKSAKENFQRESYQTDFIVSDIYHFKTAKLYDVSICQASLRHMNQPVDLLTVMRNSVKKDGLVVSIEINREIENIGLYIDGMEYERLCSSFDRRRLWLSELNNEGRDYAIGFRIPFYMKQIGLNHVDVRMNDKVTLITPEHEDYAYMRDAWITYQGWDSADKQIVQKNLMDLYMSRGYKRSEVEDMCDSQREIQEYIEKNREHISFLHVFGFLISYGRN